MKRNNTFHPVLVLLMAVALFPAGIAASPVVSIADPDSYFDLRPEDCPDCTAAQSAELADGLRILLTRLREGTSNPQGSLCDAEASFARAMSVLTYDLVRQGAISPLRWRDYVRARGTIAGLSEVTREEALLAYLERVAAGSETPIEPGSLLGRQLRIHGAAQLSRLFSEIALGEWHSEAWMLALADTAGGFNPVVDAVLGITGRWRTSLDHAVVESEAPLTWIEGQLAHLGHLPDDFRVGSIPSERDNLRAAYRDAMEAQQWTVFHFLEGGCGWELAHAWREEALRSSDGLVVRRDKHIHVDDEVTVVGDDPGPGDPISPLPTPPPPGGRRSGGSTQNPQQDDGTEEPLHPSCAVQDESIGRSIWRTYFGSGDCGASVRATAEERGCPAPSQAMQDRMRECQQVLDNQRPAPSPWTSPIPGELVPGGFRLCRKTCQLVGNQVDYIEFQVAAEVALGWGLEGTGGGGITVGCQCSD